MAIQAALRFASSASSFSLVDTAWGIAGKVYMASAWYTRRIVFAVQNFEVGVLLYEGDNFFSGQTGIRSLRRWLSCSPVWYPDLWNPKPLHDDLPGPHMPIIWQSSIAIHHPYFSDTARLHFFLIPSLYNPLESKHYQNRLLECRLIPMLPMDGLAWICLQLLQRLLCHRLLVLEPKVINKKSVW